MSSDAWKTEVELGTRIARMIKNTLYADKGWFECYKEVARDLTKLKTLTKTSHPESTTIELLKLLGKYDQNDIRDHLA